EPILQVEQLSVELATPAGHFRPVDGVSFALRPGEVMGLVGESGCGKSMTCRAVMRLLPSRHIRIAGGRVMLEGTDLLALDEARMQRVRGEKIGMIFQNPTAHLDPVMSIGEQIGESLRLHKGMTRREALREAASLLRRVGIPDPDLRVRSLP